MAPRLLLLFEYPTLHGGEHSLLSCLPAIREAGFEMIALAPGGPLTAALESGGVEVYASGSSGNADQNRSQSARRERLAAAMTRLRPKLLHSNSLSMSRLAGPVAAESCVPSLGHLRDIISLSRQAAADINRNDRLLAVSQAARQWHIGQGLEADRIHICHNGVDLERFQPRPPTGYLHCELNLRAEALLVGSIGQLVMRKGLDMAMQAMQSVLSSRRDVHWVIVGERFSQKAEAVEYERLLREAASKPPVAGRVHFLGVRDDVNRILNELALLIHAARQEPLGRVILEAAGAGVPVIATDVGGAAEILPRPTFAELLTPAEVPAAFAVAINRLLENSALRVRVSQHLRERAKEAFGNVAAGRRLVEHYRAVAARNLS